MLLGGGIVYNQVKAGNLKPGSGSQAPGASLPPSVHGGQNNPGNIRVNAANDWNGKIAPVPGQVFENFDTLQDGVHALYQTLITYRSNYNLTTVRGIITRYSPRNENDTQLYIDAVSSFMGVGADDQLTLDQYPALVSAITDEEGNTAVTVSEVNNYLANS